ncbi:GNAT family N-acetyltransferase [Anaerocolumna jejuensis]|uniref:GNAT family N-acetyltransferase n=1 Tax=Anaerocolumna jejuensis TaxID=259063 RepID=UPI003F7BCD37
MKITIKELDTAYCNAMAELLNSDEKLHLALSPDSPHININGKEYYDGCKTWEKRKNGNNFVILDEDRLIGSISYHKISLLTAGCGYWIKSSLWGKGYGKEAFAGFLPVIKKAGFEYVTANIWKDNIASLKIWEKYTSDIREEEGRYIPLIKLV